MAQFGTTEVNVVTSGTVIRDADTGEELATVTDDDAVFHRGAVYVTGTTWDRMKAEIGVMSHPPAGLAN